MKKISGVLGMSIVIILSMALISFAAGDYPNRSVTIICPHPPGGVSDLWARAFAMVAEKYLGKPLVVVTKTGASGMIGVLAGAQADPDGYTLTMALTTITCNIEGEIAEGRKPPFTRNDFATVGSFSLTGGTIIVGYDHPWKSMADFLRDCKARPNYYRYSSPGLNSAAWIGTQRFMNAAGIQCLHVPFKGSGDATVAVIGKHVDFTLAAIPPTYPLAEGKKVRMLGLVAKQRPRSVPNIPTLEELGIQDSDMPIWVGVLVPKKTPDDIVKKLREVAEKAAKDKQFVDTMEKTGDEVYFMNGDELAKYWATESENIAQVYRRLAKEKGPSK